MTLKNGAEHMKAQAASMEEYYRQEWAPVNSLYNWKKKFQSVSGFVKVSPKSEKIEFELSNGTKLLVTETDLEKVLGALNALQ